MAMLKGSAFVQFQSRDFSEPSIGDVITELMIFVAPLWIAVLEGVLVGWSWKPKRATVNGDKDSTPHTAPVFSFFFQKLSSSFSSLTSIKLQLAPFISVYLIGKESTLVDKHDLRHICLLTKETDIGPAWIQMMNRSTNTMSYQAWRRDPKRKKKVKSSKKEKEVESLNLVSGYEQKMEEAVNTSDIPISDTTSVEALSGVTGFVEEKLDMGSSIPAGDATVDAGIPEV